MRNRKQTCTIWPFWIHSIENSMKDFMKILRANTIDVWKTAKFRMIFRMDVTTALTPFSSLKMLRITWKKGKSTKIVKLVMWNPSISIFLQNECHLEKKNGKSIKIQPKIASNITKEHKSNSLSPPTPSIDDLHTSCLTTFTPWANSVTISSALRMYASFRSVSSRWSVPARVSINSWSRRTWKNWCLWIRLWDERWVLFYSSFEL